MQRWADSRHVPLAPSEEQNVTKNYSVSKSAVGCVTDSLGERLLSGWQVKLMLVP